VKDIKQLPQGWRRITLAAALGDSRRTVSGPFGSNLTQADYRTQGVPVIRGVNMSYGERYLGGEFVFVSPEKAQELKSNLTMPDDIVVTQRGTVGQVSIVPRHLGYRSFVISQSQMAIRMHDAPLDRDFLFSFLASPLFAKYVATSTIQTGLPHINLGLLREAPINVPPLDEQRSIAAVLKTWDGSIEKLSQQIERKETVFGYLRENLICGELRRARRSRPWPIVGLREVTKALVERNGSRFGRGDVMGVTKANGLIPMKEHVVADHIGRYLVVPPRAFAYNPMRLNIGSIVMSELAREVVVSPDYVVFACDERRLNPRFLNHLRRTKIWSDFMAIAGNGSVRVRIYYDDLADFEFRLPSISEQESIIRLLDDGEREIAALKYESTAFERQRGALATELLTGQRRVHSARCRAIA
jgi:type I restriction enzyme S subunit